MTEPAALDREIDAHKAAMRRYRVELDRMASEARFACCPTCMFGTAFGSVSDKSERCGKWLQILLKKRGSKRDLELADAIRVSAWP